MTFDEFWGIVHKHPSLTLSMDDVDRFREVFQLVWDIAQTTKALEAANAVQRFATEHIGKVLYHPEYALRELEAQIRPRPLREAVSS